MKEKDNYIELFNKRQRIDADELDVSGLNKEQQFNLIDVWVSWYFREPWQFEKKSIQYYLILKKEGIMYFVNKDDYIPLKGWRKVGEIFLDAVYFEDYQNGDINEIYRYYYVAYKYKFMNRNKEGYLIIDFP